jgi:hypothetical protein
MKRVKRWWGQVFDALRLVDHRILNAVRGRGIHLLLTGTDRDALHSLVDLVSQTSGLRVPPRPTRAQDTQNDPRKVVVSWGLDDLTDFQSVRDSVGRFRNVLVVVATADPRNSVCARDRSVPHQPMDSADYSIEGTQWSLTAPGVLPRLRALDELRQETPHDLLEIEQSDLRNPPQVLSSLAAFLGSSGKRLRSSSVGGAQHVTAVRPNWCDNTESIRRVASQIRLHPELEERATREGYPAASALVDQKQLSVR